MKRIRTSFMPDMIRALLAGLKSQTRRALNPQPAGSIPAPDRDSYPVAGTVINGVACIKYTNGEMQGIPLRCGNPGDVMHVVEPHIITDYEERPGGLVFVQGTYCADGTRLDAVLTPRESALFLARKRKTNVVVPGRFMYDSLVRLKLPITDVRVELLGDISEEDAKAEGVPPAIISVEAMLVLEAKKAEGFTWCPYITEFRGLWEYIYGEANWNLNPWVAVITFTPYAAAGVIADQMKQSGVESLIIQRQPSGRYSVRAIPLEPPPPPPATEPEVRQIVFSIYRNEEWVSSLQTALLAKVEQCRAEPLGIGQEFSLWQGVQVKARASDFVPLMGPALCDQAHDEMGDAADGWAFGWEQNKALQEAVENAVDHWANTHGTQPTFYRVTNVEEIRVRVTHVEPTIEVEILSVKGVEA